MPDSTRSAVDLKVEDVEVQGAVCAPACLDRDRSGSGRCEQQRPGRERVRNTCAVCDDQPGSVPREVGGAPEGTCVVILHAGERGRRGSAATPASRNGDREHATCVARRHASSGEVHNPGEAKD